MIDEVVQRLIIETGEPSSEQCRAAIGKNRRNEIVRSHRMAKDRATPDGRRHRHRDADGVAIVPCTAGRVLVSAGDFESALVYSSRAIRRESTGDCFGQIDAEAFRECHHRRRDRRVLNGRCGGSRKLKCRYNCEAEVQRARHSYSE